MVKILREEGSKTIPPDKFPPGKFGQDTYTPQNQDCTLYFVLSVTLFIYDSRFVNGCMWKPPEPRSLWIESRAGPPRHSGGGSKCDRFGGEHSRHCTFSHETPLRNEAPVHTNNHTEFCSRSCMYCFLTSAGSAHTKHSRRQFTA